MQAEQQNTLTHPRIWCPLRRSQHAIVPPPSSTHTYHTPRPPERWLRARPWSHAAWVQNPTPPLQDMGPRANGLNYSIFWAVEWG